VACSDRPQGTCVTSVLIGAEKGQRIERRAFMLSLAQEPELSSTDDSCFASGTTIYNLLRNLGKWVARGSLLFDGSSKDLRSEITERHRLCQQLAQISMCRSRSIEVEDRHDMQKVTI
jgi:hypothetical protein